MFGERIRELREEKGLSQKQLGEALKVTQSTMGKYEREEIEPSVDMIMALCKYFDVTSDYLLGLEDETGAKISKFVAGWTIGMYGKRLRELREEKGLLQKQLAEELATSQSAIGRYEREEREPNIQMIIEICKYFDVTADYLLGLEDETGARTK